MRTPTDRASLRRVSANACTALKRATVRRPVFSSSLVVHQADPPSNLPRSLQTRSGLAATGTRSATATPSRWVISVRSFLVLAQGATATDSSHVVSLQPARFTPSTAEAFHRCLYGTLLFPRRPTALAWQPSRVDTDHRHEHPRPLGRRRRPSSPVDPRSLYPTHRTAIDRPRRPATCKLASSFAYSLP